jgi:hypothetical protein
MSLFLFVDAEKASFPVSLLGEVARSSYFPQNPSPDPARYLSFSDGLGVAVRDVSCHRSYR